MARCRYVIFLSRRRDLCRLPYLCAHRFHAADIDADAGADAVAEPLHDIPDPNTGCHPNLLSFAATDAVPNAHADRHAVGTACRGAFVCAYAHAHTHADTRADVGAFCITHGHTIADADASA